MTQRTCALPAARALRLAGLLALAMLGAGCGTSPPPQWLHLPTAAPGMAGSAAAAVAASTAGVSVQLMTPIRLPDYLDRDALLVPQGAAGLVRVEGYRWAEPLREAVPRVLRADLAALLGDGRLWTTPLPPGAAPQRQWRVEISAFEADEPRRLMRLRASWTSADARGTVPPQANSVQIEVPVADAGAPALAVAHRVALRQLAEHMVASLAAPPAVVRPVRPSP